MNHHGRLRRLEMREEPRRVEVWVAEDEDADMLCCVQTGEVVSAAELAARGPVTMVTMALRDDGDALDGDDRRWH